MFTGIVEELGVVKEFTKNSSSALIHINAEKVVQDVKIGDSIAVNGVCLTVIDFGNGFFKAQISHETLAISRLSEIRHGEKVNLERAVKVGERLSGHIVTGHVDCVATVTKRVDTAEFSTLVVYFDKKFSPLVIKKGSIAVDGVSLTVNDVGDDWFRLDIIPHTLKNTNLQFLKVSSKVNVEFDIIGKYILKSLDFKTNKKDAVSIEFLQKAGFSGGKFL